MLIDEEPRLGHADTFRTWWDRLVDICPPHAPRDKERCDTAWAALAISGQEAGAIPKGAIALDIAPTFDWHQGTIDFALTGLDDRLDRLGRYDPETMITLLADLTGIPE